MSTDETTRPSPADVAETYFRAWRGHDWALLRSVLADDVTFRGPLASIASPAPTANRSRVEDGRITAVHVAFDAWELTATR